VRPLHAVKANPMTASLSVAILGPASNPPQSDIMSVDSERPAAVPGDLRAPEACPRLCPRDNDATRLSVPSARARKGRQRLRSPQLHTEVPRSRPDAEVVTVATNVLLASRFRGSGPSAPIRQNQKNCRGGKGLNEVPPFQALAYVGGGRSRRDEKSLHWLTG
jgi:hypothetical protein